MPKTIEKNRKTLNNVCLLASDNARARAYLDLLIKEGLYPSLAIYLITSNVVKTPTVLQENDLFDNTTPITETLNKHDIPTITIETESLNNEEVIKEIHKLKQDIIIFAGPAGGLLTEGFFAKGKKFLHAHPGKLPEYRGSTPMYYSLINENNITVTALFLNEKIDEGEIIQSKTFTEINDKTLIDTVYDPYFRATVITDVIKNYTKNGSIKAVPQETDKGETYCIIHPLLKHIAILGNN